jgi:hypothetical protein
MNLREQLGTLEEWVDKVIGFSKGIKLDLIYWLAK